MSDNQRQREQNSKVGRVIEAYGLTGLGAELEARWTGEDGPRKSLRELAAEFNRRVLRVAMTEAGLSPLETEVESKYRALTDDDTSSGVRTQVRRDLERKGVDIDTVESDFVTHQAIHTYLTKYRKAQFETDSDRLETARETIMRLKRRTLVVVEDALERLRTHGYIGTGELNVVVDVRVTCVDCETQWSIRSLLDDGGCECDSED